MCVTSGRLGQIVGAAAAGPHQLSLSSCCATILTHTLTHTHTSLVVFGFSGSFLSQSEARLDDREAPAAADWSHQRELQAQ